MSLIVERLGRCEYAHALALQEELVAHKIAGAADDHLLLLEHDAVYTLGRGADAEDLLGADRLLGVPVFRVGRGGGVTFHGPGQLVAYPILTLTKADRDVRGYIRNLEQVLIDVCKVLGVAAERQAGQTGVWVAERKIASIGVGIRRWTTFHGIALNVSTDLSFFSAVVACRMPDVRMTSIERETGRAPALAEVAALFEWEFRRTFGFDNADVALSATG